MQATYPDIQIRLMNNGGTMNTSKKTKLMLLVLAVVVELVAVYMIARAYAAESSPTIGLTGLVIGLVLLVIAMTRKSESGKAGEN